MDVPAEKEGCIAAESDGADEGVPGWVKEELDQRDNLEDQGEDEGHACGDLREDGEGGVAYEASSYAVDCVLVDGKFEVWGSCSG